MSCGRETGFSDLASERLSDLTSQSINPPIIQALFHFEWVTKEKGSNAKALTGAQNCFTTKDTKSTKESEDEALDLALKLGRCSNRSPVYYTPRGNIAQPIAVFDNPSSSILRVLRALRGEVSSASVQYEPELEVTTCSKLQGTSTQLFNFKWAFNN